MAIRRHARTPFIAPPDTEASVQGGRVSMEECADDPVSALIELQDEQRLIADELEDTFYAYDQKLQAAAKRIASLGSASVTAEERARLREEQLELWRLVRRAQVAQRSTRELVREVREWQAHEPTVAPEGHPDHPDTRVEIVESELRVRGVLLPEAVVSPVHPVDAAELAMLKQSSHPQDVLGTHLPRGIQWLHRVLEEGEAGGVAVDSAVLPEWEHDTDEHLLREIRHHEKELARTTQPADISDLLKSLRALHGHLRAHDRRAQRSRIRYTLGFGSA